MTTFKKLITSLFVLSLLFMAGSTMFYKTASADSQPIQLLKSTSTGQDNDSIFYGNERVYIFGHLNNAKSLVEYLRTYNVSNPSSPKLISSLNLHQSNILATKSGNYIYAADIFGSKPGLYVISLSNPSAPVVTAERSLPKPATSIAADTQGNVYIAFNNIINHYQYSGSTVTAVGQVNTGQSYTGSTISGNDGLYVIGNYLVQFNNPENGIQYENINIYNKSALGKPIYSYSTGPDFITTMTTKGYGMYVSLLNASDSTAKPVFTKLILASNGKSIAQGYPLQTLAGSGYQGYATSIAIANGKILFSLYNGSTSNYIDMYTNTNSPTKLDRVAFNGVDDLASDSSANLYAISGGDTFNSYLLSN